MKLRLSLVCVLLLMLVAFPVYAQMELDPDNLPAWEKVELTESFTLSDPSFGDLVINYPEGWVVADQEDGQLYVANSEDTLDALTSDDITSPLPGQVGGILLPLPAIAAASIIDPDSDVSASVALLDAILAGMTGENEDTEFAFGEILELDLDGINSAVVSGTGETETGEPLDVLAFMTDLTDVFAFSLFISAPDELELYADSIFAIVARMEVPSGESDGDGEVDFDLPQTITDESAQLGTLTLSIPEDYAAFAGGGQIAIGNSQFVVDRTLEDNPEIIEYADDEFGMIAIPLPEDLIGEVGVDLTEPLTDGLINLVNAIFTTLTTDVELDEPEEVEFGDLTGVIVSGTVTEGDVTTAGIFALIEVEGGYVLLVGVSSVDGIEDYIPVFRAVAATAVYEAP